MGYDGVMRLVKEHPDWLPRVKACYEAVAESRNGEFAGSRVFEKIGYAGWFPNLRGLVKYGILKHEYSTSGKRKAYYTMPNKNGVGRALRELRMI